jgi:hypothetical protein
VVKEASPAQTGDDQPKAVSDGERLKSHVDADPPLSYNPAPVCAIVQKRKHSVSKVHVESEVDTNSSLEMGEERPDKRAGKS